MTTEAVEKFAPSTVMETAVNPVTGLGEKLVTTGAGTATGGWYKSAWYTPVPPAIRTCPVERSFAAGLCRLSSVVAESEKCSLTGSKSVKDPSVAKTSPLGSDEKLEKSENPPFGNLEKLFNIG